MAKPVDCATVPKNALVNVPAGAVTIGKGDPHADACASAGEARRYGWDNEYGVHYAEVPKFSASRMLVSNAEFLAFVDAGGYAKIDSGMKKGWAGESLPRRCIPPSGSSSLMGGPCA